MLAEIYFLRYAFSCARVLVDFRKTLSEEEYERLRKAVETETPVDRKYLEEIFHHAIEGMKEISDDYWRVEVIQEYFWNKHKEHLSKDLPPTVKRLCVVKKGRLVKKIGNYFEADLGEGDVRCISTLYPDAKEDDAVMVHYGYAVERV